MGHKIHPTGLRLGITQEHRSRWYASSKTYPSLLQEDDRIRKFIQDPQRHGVVSVEEITNQGNNLLNLANRCTASHAVVTEVPSTKFSALSRSPEERASEPGAVVWACWCRYV